MGHYRRAYGSSATNSCMSCSTYVSFAWPITPSVGDHCTPSAAQRHFYRTVSRPKSEHRKKDTYDISDELLIARHDGAPRSWTTTVYAIRIKRIWTASMEMRDCCLRRVRVTLFSRVWLLLLGCMPVFRERRAVDICGR